MKIGFLELMSLECKLVLKISILSMQEGHLLRNLLRRLLDDLVNVHFGPDRFSLWSKIQSLEGLLCILGKLADAADDRGLRLAKQRIL